MPSEHLSTHIQGSADRVKRIEEALDKAMQDAGLRPGNREENQSNVWDEKRVRKEYLPVQQGANNTGSYGVVLHV